MQPGCLGRGTWWLRGSELGTLPRAGGPSLSPGPKARGAGENNTVAVCCRWPFDKVRGREKERDAE